MSIRISTQAQTAAVAWERPTAARPDVAATGRGPLQDTAETGSRRLTAADDVAEANRAAARAIPDQAAAAAFAAAAAQAITSHPAAAVAAHALDPSRIAALLG